MKALLSAVALGCLATPAFGRLCMPLESADLRRMIEKAPLVFRGREVNQAGDFGERQVRVQVLRAYRGDPRAEADIRFHGLNYPSNPGAAFLDGEGPDWLVFGQRKGESIELFNSCWSAVPVSPEFGEDPGGSDLRTRLEAEFRAGLRDSNQRGREISVQRLGGLQTPSARALLIEVLGSGSDRERFWAAYALLLEGNAPQVPRSQALEAIATGLADADVYHRWADRTSATYSR